LGSTTWEYGREVVMFFSDHDGQAKHALDGLHSLLDQQEYEFERLIADLQLTARVIDEVLTRRHITADAVETLHAAAVNCKHDIRNARHELAEAVDRLRQTADQLMQLEWQEADR
jgi:ABC-type transporter Mla subunit MlaD